MIRILILLLLPMASLCQALTKPDTLVLSRNEAMHIGITNRFDVKANEQAVSAAMSKRQQAKNNWLPDVQVDGMLKYSPQLRNSVIPGGVLLGFDKTTQLPLTVKNETVFSLNLLQPIYNAELSNNEKLADNEIALQKERSKAAKIDIMLNISRSYLDVTLRTLQRKIAADIASRNKEYEHIAEGMYKNGALIENLYLRAKLDRENAEHQQQQAEQDYALSLMHLYYQMNVPQSTQLMLSDSLDVAVNHPVTPMTETGQRTELRQLQLMQQEHELNLRKYRQRVLPSVDLGANYSQQYLSGNFNYGAANTWSPFSYLSLNIRIPIAAHYKNKAYITEYKHEIQRNEWLITQKKADIDYEIQQAQTQLGNAVLNMRTAKSSYDLSKTIYHNQQQQYQLGVFNYSDLLDTEKSLSVTERNYIQTAYDFIIAQIRLQKATNNFTFN